MYQLKHADELCRITNMARTNLPSIADVSDNALLKFTLSPQIIGKTRYHAGLGPLCGGSFALFHSRQGPLDHICHALRMTSCQIDYSSELLARSAIYQDLDTQALPLILHEFWCTCSLGL